MLQFSPPNTTQAEALKLESRLHACFFRNRHESEFNEGIRELVSYGSRGRPKQKALSRRAHGRAELGKTKVGCGHEAYFDDSGRFERLLIEQRQWRDCDGQIEARVHYPPGSTHPGVTWMSCRSQIRQPGDYWFELPNFSLLVVADRDDGGNLVGQRLMQVDHDQGQGIVRLFSLNDQGVVSGAWGGQFDAPGLIIKVRPWSYGDRPWPQDYENRLRSLASSSEGVVGLDTDSGLDGIVDYRKLIEAIRVQTEDGPADLARLAFDTGLAG